MDISGSSLISGITSEFAWRNREKSLKPSLRTAGVQAETWIQNLLSTKRDWGCKCRSHYVKFSYLSVLFYCWYRVAQKLLNMALLWGLLRHSVHRNTRTFTVYMSRVPSFQSYRHQTDNNVQRWRLQAYKNCSLPEGKFQPLPPFPSAMPLFLTDTELTRSSNCSGVVEVPSPRNYLAYGHRQWYSQ